MKYEIMVEATLVDGTHTRTRVRTQTWVQLMAAWRHLENKDGRSPWVGHTDEELEHPEENSNSEKMSDERADVRVFIPPQPPVSEDILKDMRDKFADDALTQNYFQEASDWERAMDCITVRTGWHKNAFNLERAHVLEICRPFAYGRKTVSAIVRPRREDEENTKDYVIEPFDGASPIDPETRAFTFTAVELLGPKAADGVVPDEAS